MVWRGHEITIETDNRTSLVNRLYSCGDPAVVRELAAEAGADLIAVGSLERQGFEPEDLEAVAAAGEIVVEKDGAFLVRIDRPAGE